MRAKLNWFDRTMLVATFAEANWSDSGMESLLGGGEKGQGIYDRLLAESDGSAKAATV